MSQNDLHWTKSSFSGPNGQCVEVAVLPAGGTAVRDSKNTEGPVLRIDSAGWSAFLSAAKSGRFDGE